MSEISTDAIELDDVSAADDPPEPELRHGVPVMWGPGGQEVLHPTREQLVDVVTALRTEGYWQCLDVAGVDYLTHPGRILPAGVVAERFEVVVLVLSHLERRRIRLRVQIPESDPTCPTLFRIHPGTEAPEREAFDLFGIRFTDHPDMTRILMPDDWEGHPLRKDYAIGRIPVQFKGAPS